MRDNTAFIVGGSVMVGGIAATAALVILVHPLFAFAPIGVVVLAAAFAFGGALAVDLFGRGR